MTRAVTNGDGDMLCLDRQICFPLYAASNLLTRVYRPLLAPLNLTYPQYLVMMVLWRQSPICVGDLGRQLYLDSGTVTPLLKRMERAGLVTRRRDTQDERRVIVRLTTHGADLRERLAHVPTKLAERIGPRLDAETAEQLRVAASTLVTILSDNFPAPSPDGMAAESLSPEPS